MRSGQKRDDRNGDSASIWRYVALAVVARNLHRLGAILLAQDAEQEKRERKRAA